MEATDGRPEQDGDAPTAPEATEPVISAYSTNQERVVFTESDNDDGWISTDLTVEPRQ